MKRNEEGAPNGFVLLVPPLPLAIQPDRRSLFDTRRGSLLSASPPLENGSWKGKKMSPEGGGDKIVGLEEGGGGRQGGRGEREVVVVATAAV